MKKVTHFQQPTPFITFQDVAHVLILIALSLILLLIPIRGFGQTVPELPVIDGSQAFAETIDFAAPPAPVQESAPAPTITVPLMSEVPASPTVPSSPTGEEFSVPPREAPVPAAATVSPATASQFLPLQKTPLQISTTQNPTAQTTLASQPVLQNPLRSTVGNTEHPFQKYWGVPDDPQTTITGSPLSVTELFSGTRTTSIRCQLLQAYWELSGLLAVYHFRCETERQANAPAEASSEDMRTLFQEQRRTAEAEFIKQQWVLAELLKQYKGIALHESLLPIPTDFPLYPRYQTYADKIARTERTQYLGRMIPIQEQVIETKNGTWKAASDMIPNATQPFFVVSDQRTTAFVELTIAIVEYNKMIAEYALETIHPNVSQRQLIGAVTRLSDQNSQNMAAQQPQSYQRATERITLTRYEVPAGTTAQPAERIASEYQSPMQKTMPTTD